MNCEGVNRFLTGEVFRKRSAVGLIILFVVVAIVFSQDVVDYDSLADEIISLGGTKRVPALCVHLGCSDGGLTSALADKGKYLVHGLCVDSSYVEQAREYLMERRQYGQVSVSYFKGPYFAYAENLVNLLVVDKLSKVSESGINLGDVVRVLVPNGMAFFGQSSGSESELRAILDGAGIQGYEVIQGEQILWARYKKPRSVEMGECTHRNYDAGWTYVS
ncbi:MAG: hypothetical protein AB1478_12515, partial [Nitrospirota bacterium]